MKAAARVRSKFLDEKYLGPEPDISLDASVINLALAYNWYNYFYSIDDSKEFAIFFLRENNADPKMIRALEAVEPINFGNIGWNCRILSNGGTLPLDIKTRMWKKLKGLSSEKEQIVTNTEEPAVNVQDRISNRVSEFIGDIEVEIDNFIKVKKSSFDINQYIRDKNLKAIHAQKIARYYKDLYSEVFDAVNGNDDQLKEAYSRWKKPDLKKYLEFIKSIVSSAETLYITSKAARKPRKKKIKPASAIVSKIKYLTKDEKLDIISRPSTEIVGANQLWTFNIGTKLLSQYVAIGSTGLTVNGSKVVGYDEKLSFARVLRKPKEQLKALLDAGKPALKKYMESIKTKQKAVNGRINTNVLLVRIVKQ